MCHYTYKHTRLIKVFQLWIKTNLIYLVFSKKNYQKKMIKLKFYNLDITKQFDMMNKLKSEQWKEWNVYITKFIIIIICIHNYYCSNSNNYSRKNCIQKKIQHKL